jgi:hypothetical protein
MRTGAAKRLPRVLRVGDRITAEIVGHSCRFASTGRLEPGGYSLSYAGHDVIGHAFRSP